MAAEIDRTPPYLQVVNQLRSQIVSGDLRDGEPIPSVRELAATWKISTATALKAVSTLKGMGLVDSIQGVGTLVRSKETLHRSAHDRFVRMRRTGRIYAPGEYARILVAELVPAPPHVASAFGIQEGDEVIRRHRVTYNEDDAPISASTSWFTGDLAVSVPELLSTERIIGGTPTAVENATGRRATAGQDRPFARGATSNDAAELGIPEGSPVQAGDTTLWDAAGDVLEFGEYVSHAGRSTTYTYTLD